MDKIDIELDSGDGLTKLWMYLMPLNCIHKNDNNSIFYIETETIKTFSKTQ